MSADRVLVREKPMTYRDGTCTDATGRQATTSWADFDVSRSVLILLILSTGRGRASTVAGLLVPHAARCRDAA